MGKNTYLWLYAFITKNLGADPTLMSRFSNVFLKQISMLPVTALKYNPQTMELDLPKSFMSPSSVRDKAIADSNEMFQAQGYDLDDIHATLSRESATSREPSKKAEEKETSRIMELAEEEKETRRAATPQVDPQVIIQMNLKDPISVPRKSAGGASVGTRDTNITSKASVDRKDSEFRWEHSLAAEEKKRAEAQRQLREAEMIAHEEKRKAEAAVSAISDIAERLRAQGIDPATVLTQAEMSASSPSPSQPAVAFSLPPETQQAQSQQGSVHMSSTSPASPPTNSQQNFPPLSSTKQEGAGPFPSGKDQRQVR